MKTPAEVRQAFAERVLPLTSDNEQRLTPEERERLRTFWAWANEMVDVVLGTDRFDAPRLFSSFTEAQQTFLDELAKIPGKQQLNAGDFSRRLMDRGAMGLDSGPDARFLRRYVGQCGPSALELEAELGGVERPLWLWLRLRMMKRIDDGAWAAAYAGLRVSQRLDVLKRATDNAYMLMKRWPLHVVSFDNEGDTDTIEREDTRTLFDALQPMLSAVPASELLHAGGDALASCPARSLLVALALSGNGQEVPAAFDAGLAKALAYTSYEHAVQRLAEQLPPARVERLVLSMPAFRWFNGNGWRALMLVVPAVAAKRLCEVLDGLETPCNARAVAAISDVVGSLDSEARRPLEDFARSTRPNASVIAGVLETAAERVGV